MFHVVLMQRQSMQRKGHPPICSERRKDREVPTWTRSCLDNFPVRRPGEPVTAGPRPVPWTDLGPRGILAKRHSWTMPGSSIAIQAEPTCMLGAGHQSWATARWETTGAVSVPAQSVRCVGIKPIRLMR